MRVLIACEESQTLCKTFRAKGHEAYSCDVMPCSGGHPEWHYKMDVSPLLSWSWDLVIAHPPCTYLTVTGNKWLKDQPLRKSGALVGAARRDARARAIEFFMLFTSLKCRYAIENPVGCISSHWRKPDQIIQPWQFGHEEPKKTCLWLRGLPKLKPTKIVEPAYTRSKSGKNLPAWFFWAAKKDRAKLRSKTFQGIADAMVEQWDFDGWEF